MSFIGTMGFSIIFNVPRKELVCCGIGGAIGWIIYQIITGATSDGLLATFFAAMAVCSVARIWSLRRKMPVMLYMIPGIIPLVPGAGIYYTMFNAVTGETIQAMLRGIQTLSIAGIIAIALLLTLSLPRKLFDIDATREALKERKTKKEGKTKKIKKPKK